MRPAGDLLPALVSFFARAAETTLARGLVPLLSRATRPAGRHVRGRIDMERQLTRPGVVIPTACRFTDFTADLDRELVHESRRVALAAGRRGATGRTGGGSCSTS